VAAAPNRLPTYWDASAILSVLFEDSHSLQAQEWARREGFHFISTLCYVETCAVIARMRRDRLLADVLTEAAFEASTKVLGADYILGRNGEWSAVLP